ncbi:hypothetical protein LY76DRAFT_161529 [Colletotrichum caudatum]|nr:hypothetical protein LY76DRAFT_161529 [Colletotrichum caudatum]
MRAGVGCLVPWKWNVPETQRDVSIRFSGCFCNPLPMVIAALVLMIDAWAYWGSPAICCWVLPFSLLRSQHRPDREFGSYCIDRWPGVCLKL